MLPDPELVLSAYLRAHHGVTALVDEIGTQTPKKINEPWIRLVLIDGVGDRTSPALHLATALLQLDCYAGAERTGAQAQASLIARTVQHAIQAMPTVAHDGAVVTKATASWRRLPDTSIEPQRERYIVEATITLHPG
jgi:hypothetical protein